MGSSRPRAQLRGFFGTWSEREFHVNCGGQLHAIRITNRGRLTLLDHPGLSPQTLGKECMMVNCETPNECLLVAGVFTVGATTAGKTLLHPSAALQELIKIRQALINPNRGYRQQPDPLQRPCRQRESPFVEEAIKKAVGAMEFRSTPRVGHDVIVIQRCNGVKMQGTKRVAKASEKVPGRPDDARQDKWRQEIRVFINDKRWARIYSLGVAVVENRFVTEIMKLRSKRDMRVRYIKQSRGYTLTSGEGNILLGSDNVWRLVGD